MDKNESNPPEQPLVDGMYGYVVVDDSGRRVEEVGRVNQSLREYLPYFNQLSELVGDSLGFDDTEELILFGKSRHAICMSIDELHYGATFKVKADRREISAFLTEKGDDNDVLA